MPVGDVLASPGMGDLVGVLVVAIVTVGLILKVRGQMSGAGVIRRQLAKSVPATVAEAEAGTVVRITGIVRAVGEAPISEISRRPFVARDLRITTEDGDGGHPTRPARQSFDFLIDDSTGVALVQARDAAVSIPRDAVLPTTTLDRVMWLDPILRASGYHHGSPQYCTVRASEGVVGPGDRISVVGQVGSGDTMARDLGARITITAGALPVAILASDD